MSGDGWEDHFDGSVEALSGAEAAVGQADAAEEAMTDVMRGLALAVIVTVLGAVVVWAWVRR